MNQMMYIDVYARIDQLAQTGKQRSWIICIVRDATDVYTYVQLESYAHL